MPRMARESGEVPRESGRRGVRVRLVLLPLPWPLLWPDVLPFVWLLAPLSSKRALRESSAFTPDLCGWVRGCVGVRVVLVELLRVCVRVSACACAKRECGRGMGENERGRERERAHTPTRAHTRHTAPAIGVVLGRARR